MLDWQKDYIKLNINKLASSTNASKNILSALRAKNHLSDVEYKNLDRCRDREESTTQAICLYDLLISRPGSYDDLIEVLKPNCQSEAVQILEKGLELYELVEATSGSKLALKKLHETGRISKPDADKLMSDSIQKPSKKSLDLFKILTPHMDALDDLIEVLKTITQDEEPPKKKQKEEKQNEDSDDEESIPLPAGIAAPDEIDASLKKYVSTAVHKTVDVKVSRPKISMVELYGKLDKYNLPEDDRGWALIINIVSYVRIDKKGNKIDNTRHGAQNDETYMLQLWKQLGYQIFREAEVIRKKGVWNKADIEDFVKSFQGFCNQEPHPKSVVIFVGGHGELNKVISSDSKKLCLYKDIVRKFYHDDKLGCPGLEGVPKIVLVNACQIFEPEKTEAELGTPVGDLLVCTAQAPGFVAWRNTSRGSWFTHCVAHVFMKYARKKSLQEMLELVTNFLRSLPSDVGKVENSVGDLVPLPHGQIPDIRITGMKTLYFLMDPTKQI